MGIELELFVLLVFAVLGQSSFARFEIETPVSRKIFKWFTHGDGRLNCPPSWLRQNGPTRGTESNYG